MYCHVLHDYRNKQSFSPIPLLNMLKQGPKGGSLEPWSFLLWSPEPGARSFLRCLEYSLLVNSGARNLKVATMEPRFFGLGALEPHFFGPGALEPLTPLGPCQRDPSLLLQKKFKLQGIIFASKFSRFCFSRTVFV